MAIQTSEMAFDRIRLIDGDPTVLANLHVHGNLNEPGSFDEADRRILSSTRHLLALRRALQRLPVNLEVHFVHVDRDLRYNHGTTARSNHLKGPNIGFLSIEHIRAIYHVEIPMTPSALTIVFVENFGAKALPFTPWMVVHRLGHVLFQSNPDPDLTVIWEDFTGTLRSVVNLYARPVPPGPGSPADEVSRLVGGLLPSQLDSYFGTAHVARNGTYPNNTEWFFDCFAQLYMTGAVSFRRAQRQIISTHGPNPNLLFELRPSTIPSTVDGIFTDLAGRLKLMWDGLLMRNVGRIAVL